MLAASSPSIDEIIEQQHAARFAKEGFPTPEQMQKEFNVQKTGAYDTYYGYVMRQANKNSLPNFDYRTWWQKQGTSGQDNLYGDEPTTLPEPGYHWEKVDTYNGRQWMQVPNARGGGFGPVPGPKPRYVDDWYDDDRDRNYWPDRYQKRRRIVRHHKRYLPYRRVVSTRRWS